MYKFYETRKANKQTPVASIHIYQENTLLFPRDVLHKVYTYGRRPAFIKPRKYFTKLFSGLENTLL